MQSCASWTAELFSVFLGTALRREGAHVSKSECLRCFRQSMGTTPYQYLMEYRLSQAAALLKRTDDPIEWIANQVGFGQASSFGKYFRRKTGLSPREYRTYGQRTDSEKT